jgi:hypothetical protein
MTKKVDTYHEQDSINDTRNQYPFPQFMFFDKPVRFKIRLYGYDHFFQHPVSFSVAKLTHSVSLHI